MTSHPFVRWSAQQSLALCLTVGIWGVGCSDDCEEARDKLFDECSLPAIDDNSAQGEVECDGAAEETARCVLDTACADITDACLTGPGPSGGAGAGGGTAGTQPLNRHPK